MDLASLLILLAILLPVVAYLVFPLLEEQETQLEDGDRRLFLLEAERERLLSTLAELDMDHSMGKLVRKDYELERAEKLVRGADVLRQIDELRSEQAAFNEQRKAREEELEARVVQLRKQGAPSRKHCPICGHVYDDEDIFCSRCGAPLDSREKSE